MPGWDRSGCGGRLLAGGQTDLHPYWMRPRLSA
jgi:hypothetical protein